MLWLFLALFADQFDAAFRAGLVALNQNNLTVAESQLEAASHLQPRNSRVWLALAQTYWKEHKAAQAKAAATNAENFSPDAVVLHGLAFYYSETADYPKATGLLRAAIRQDPLAESYYFELAQMLLQRQDFAAALETIDAGRKKFDTSPQLTLAAGVAYYGLRRFPEAIDAFLRTIELDPAVEQPYVFLGRMLDQAENRLPKITAVFATFAGIMPDSYMGNYLYGKALMAGGDARKAEPLLRQSIEQNGDFWESHFELSVLLDARGKLDDAAQEMRRAIELNPNDAPSHYRLARLYDRLGKPAEARAEREEHARLSAAARSAAGIK